MAVLTRSIRVVADAEEASLSEVGVLEDHGMHEDVAVERPRHEAHPLAALRDHVSPLAGAPHDAAALVVRLDLIVEGVQVDWFCCCQTAQHAALTEGLQDVFALCDILADLNLIDNAV
jgi:hypothetical protein